MGTGGKQICKDQDFDQGSAYAEEKGLCSNGFGIEKIRLT
jgi:hypothetical protein